MRKDLRMRDFVWSVEQSLGKLVVLVVIAVFLVVFLVWASNCTIEKTVRAQGVVETNLTDKIVGHYEGGVVEQVFVQEGDDVEAGQPLVTIANTMITKERNKSEIKQKRLSAKLDRLAAESAGTVAEFAARAKSEEELSELQFARYREEALAERIRILQTQIDQTQAALVSSENHMANMREEEKVIRQQHDMLAPMVERGIGSRQLLLQRKADLARIVTSIDEVSRKREEYDLKIQELRQRINRERLDFLSEVREEISTVSSELQAVTEEVNAANEQIVRSVVRSPIDGTIYKLSANTVGGIVRSGEALAEIVPKTASIQIEGKVQPGDRTKIWNGMSAKIRPSRYEFSEDTMLLARIVNISAKTYFDDVTRTWYYRVILETVKGDAHKAADFLPGMIVEVNILSGEETVLDYLLSPVLRGMRGALSEHRTR
ncbi:MAG: HlyD family type I secretion periplasmic adaptor subunit [Desulfovibrionaceae bacterium]|jgi:adhesin transport system membrane fusion protein|nr:HlyD family type I secretion periplasmic adaptor subunit [Desulfovibrionaceae bacterium]